MQNCKKAALEYIKRGWRIVPLYWIEDGACACHEGRNCERPAKHPIGKWRDEGGIIDRQKVKEVFLNYPNANIGIVTGKMSGIVVIDIDSDEGQEHYDSFKAPETVGALTGGGGSHYIFKYPEIDESKVIGNKTSFCPGVDCRGDGGLIVASPSKHISGRSYCWNSDFHPDETKLADLPQNILKHLVEDKQKHKKSEPLPERIIKGQQGRNSTLASWAGTMRKRGATEAEIFACTQVINESRCDPQLSTNEISDIAKKIAKYEPDKVPNINPGDDPNQQIEPFVLAENFIEANNLHMKIWRDDYYLYTGKKYQRLDKDRFIAKIQDWLRADFAMAKYMGKNKVKQMLDCYKRDEFYIDSSVDINVTKGMIPCQNGIYDIKRDKLLPHSPEFICTYVLPFDYSPNAECPTYDELLNEVLDPEHALIWNEVVGAHFYQEKNLERFAMLHGEGGNGKTVLLTILATILGPENVSNVSLDQFDGQSFLMAETLGKLANIIPELPYIDKANEGAIKAFTTKEIMSFNRKFKDAINARPTAFLTIATNALPNFKDRSDGIWRRMLLFEFQNQVPEHRRDRRFIDPEFWIHSGEMPGILNRAIQGIRRFHDRGDILESPDMFKNKTSYRSDLNPVQMFVNECVAFEPGAQTPTRFVYEAFVRWAKNNGYKAQYLPQSRGLTNELKREFKRTGKDAGLSEKSLKIQGVNTYVWQGIRIVDNVVNIDAYR